MKNEIYESPLVKVVEVVVEKGFAASGSIPTRPETDITINSFVKGQSNWL